jgi:hypothetical protein
MGTLKKRLAFASLVSFAVLSVLIAGCGSNDAPVALAVPPTTTFLYTSDAHYGIKRAAFSGMSSAQQINGALVGVMNSIPTVILPPDGGINSGATVGAVDFVVETGDASNRSDGSTTPRKNATASETWPQFVADYFNTLSVKDRSGNKAPLYMTPGNHDVSNAIGYYKAPLNADAGLDATSYTAIYNLMMKPATPLTNASFSTYAAAAASYAGKRVVTSRDVNGVHLVFVGMWPDSVARPLIDADLAKVPTTTPVILFTHDQPDAESKHFTNPIAPYTINTANKFENLLADTFAETTPNSTPYSDAAGTIAIPSIIEQQAFVTWLKTHRNIVAYFHGNDNANEYYTYPTTDPTSPKYLGPGYSINLNVFRVDSPMKGNFSATDATKLSFQVISIDSGAKNMTVREYLWNTKAWGASKTVSLAPRAL